MYCPNCGVKIHEEGSFCAKCRKDVAYLTQKPDEQAVPTESEVTDIPAEPELEPVVVEQKKPADKPKKPGYYCNYCGTFVYPEDHYCYSCGKKTRPKYYTNSKDQKKSKKPLYIGLGVGTVVLILIIGILLR